MATKLYLVYGGELKNPQEFDFIDPAQIDIIGVFDDYESAYDAWKNNAQRTVDNAHMRYFIANLNRLQDETDADSDKE